MYAQALIRASFGFVGLCLVAFVQHSASGSRTTPGRSLFFFLPCLASAFCLLSHLCELSFNLQMPEAMWMCMTVCAPLKVPPFMFLAF